MKKVICMVMAIVATLSITGCHKAETPADPTGSNGAVAEMVSDAVSGLYPLEYYREERTNDWGFPYITEGITFKGWEHR